MHYRLLLAFTGTLSLCGCAAMSEWLAQPGVSEGLSQVGSGAVRAATNPLDFFAWYEIAAGITAIVAGPPAAVALKRKVAQVVKEKVLNPPTTIGTSTPDQTLRPEAHKS